MFRFYDNQHSQFTTITQYSAFNGVMTLHSYDPQSFHAHLLISLRENGTIRDLSFSSLSNDLKSCAFTINFGAESNINVTFQSSHGMSHVYYATTTKLPDDMLKNTHQITTDIYLHIKKYKSCKLDPKKILGQLSSCVNTHHDIIEVGTGDADSICKNLPMFIQLITNKLSEELQQLKHKLTESLNTESNTTSKLKL